MPSNGSNKEQKLRDEGIIVEGELPVPYQHLVAGLTKHEVQMLVGMKRRLEATEEWHKTLDPNAAAFTTFMIF